MAKFADFSDGEKIQFVRDTFLILLMKMAKNPPKIREYLKLNPLAPIAPVFIPIPEDILQEEKDKIILLNKELEEKTSFENKKLEEEYLAKEAQIKKIEEIISGFKKQEGCVCGSCIDLNIINKPIPSELEPIIDIARREAEEKQY